MKKLKESLVQGDVESDSTTRAVKVQSIIARVFSDDYGFEHPFDKVIVVARESRDKTKIFYTISFLDTGMILLLGPALINLITRRLLIENIQFERSNDRHGSLVFNEQL